MLLALLIGGYTIIGGKSYGQFLAVYLLTENEFVL